jgi:hypothetical protein
MRAKKPPKREWALVSVTGKYLVKRAGKPIVILAKQPPRGERFSNKYRKAGLDFAAVEVEYSQHHVGPPVYSWPNEQVAVIRKTISTKEV